MASLSKQAVIFQDLGWMEYQAAWDYQEALLRENVAVKIEARARESAVSAKEGQTVNLESSIPDKAGQAVNRQLAVGSEQFAEDASDTTQLPTTTNYLLFVEHPPVYTLGKSGSIGNVLINEQERQTKGIGFYHTNRGGDITFHGPEQIVGYPILDLEKFYTDIGKYLRNLEEVIIATMAEYGLKGERSRGETGVWMDASVPGKERKICAMGIRCSRWVTMHGFAFNVNTDLTYFDHIIPCGIQNKQVTSLEKELGHTVDINEVKEKLKANFEKVFEVELVSL